MLESKGDDEEQEEEAQAQGQGQGGKRGIDQGIKRTADRNHPHGGRQDQ